MYSVKKAEAENKMDKVEKKEMAEAGVQTEGPCLLWLCTLGSHPEVGTGACCPGLLL